MGDQQEQNETTVLGRRAFLGAIGAGVLAARLANAEAAVSDEPAWSFAVVADPHLREDRQGEPTGVAAPGAGPLRRCARAGVRAVTGTSTGKLALCFVEIAPLFS